MRTSVVPAVIDALVEKANATLGADVKVFDGFGNTEDYGDFLMIGVEDPDARDFDNAASSDQEWAHANFTARNEEGDITCAVMSSNGDGDQKAARDAAFSIITVVETFLRDDPSLGLVPSAADVLIAQYGAKQELSQFRDSDSGVLAMVIFQVHFKARI